MDRCNKCGSFKYTDICPDYKNKKLLDIFIKSRETDIKNIQLAIKDAKKKKITLSNDFNL